MGYTEGGPNPKDLGFKAGAEPTEHSEDAGTFGVYEQTIRDYVGADIDHINERLRIIEEELITLSRQLQSESTEPGEIPPGSAERARVQEQFDRLQIEKEALRSIKLGHDSEAQHSAAYDRDIANL